MRITEIGSASTPLTAADLLPDEPLRGAGSNPIADSEDLLHHRVIATKVAELATSANGKVNIALFGPWGAGKSSFNALLAEELKALDPKVRHITFDAWKNAGQGFQTNFLSELARQIPTADQDISDQLFQATTRVTFPLVNKYTGDPGRKAFVWKVVGLLLALFIGGPLAWTFFGSLLNPVDDFLAQWWTNVVGWAGIAVSSTLLVVVGAGLVELSKVTIAESTPSHVAQFSELFDKLLNTDKKRRFVVFIDELDRCGEADVMATLEGLRTFLGHERCVFVVAFDRDAIATTIAEHMQHNVPSRAASPYYRTSGEYLDKIFQFQLSLPPQPAHTFRRYALSLVLERGGVWAQLRTHQEGLLDRIITVLSPMHLASPRRTKVLLNDFAVNVRVYESLGFEWLDRAEEIAVLTVLQTEFPNLMADVERTPSLMRFLYREENPKRPEVGSLLARYQLPSKDDDDAQEVPLDRIVGDDDSDRVARDLQANLARYLRRLREMNVPEPMADLVMMHSDKALLHFEDPGVYHEVLLAADMPRKDVLEALSAASPSDRSLAIDHLLEQAERESTQIALSLRMVAGELAADLPSVSSKQGSNLRSSMSLGLSGHGRKSLEGYARAVAASYTQDAASSVIAAAAERSGETLGAVLSRLTDELTPKDWMTTQPLILSRLLPTADALPNVTARVLRRMGEDLRVELDSEQINQLAASLSVTKPKAVEPVAATAAARRDAEEQNTQALEKFEQDREEVRAAASAIAEAWSQLPVDGRMRRSLLSALRTARGDSDWHLDLHDQLVARDVEAGAVGTANSHLLAAIAEQPHQAAARWCSLLSDDVHVEAEEKSRALDAVVTHATTTTSARSRDNAADNAFRIACLPSDPVQATGLLAKIADDITVDWDEYSDSRFEYQLKLLSAMDLLEDECALTTPHRVRLFVHAVASARQEGASVDQIAKAVQVAAPRDADAVAMALVETRLWEGDAAEYSLQVVLAAQERTLSAGEDVVPLPASAISQLGDNVRSSLAEAWLCTAPAVDQVRTLLGSVTFVASAWQKYGERISEEQRAETWEMLVEANVPTAALRALSLAGQRLSVYEGAAARVRDAMSKDAREFAIDRFLALPVSPDFARGLQALVKIMAIDKKRTELPLGLRLVKAYFPHWSKPDIAGLRQPLTDWVEAGEAYLARRDLTWLVDTGLIVQKSSIWEQMFRGKKK